MSVPTVGIAGRNNYLALLENAWAEHLAPRAADAPTVISSFAGAGGSSLGYSMAGYREILAIEWDDNAVRTFRRNFPGVPVFHGDIAQLAVDDALEMVGVQPGELDVFDGSPPCQGFSTLGKRQIDDPRNQLFREYVRLLRGFRPKMFVMENVYGLVKGKMKLVFADILADLKGCGYQVKAARLNAAYFGVPQARERLIFIGVRNDLGLPPSHPPAQTRPFTAEQALEGVIINEAERQMLLDAGRKYAAYREWQIIGPGKKRSNYFPKGGGFTAAKLAPHKPARTLVKNDSHVSMHGLMHWAERRRFTVGEYQRFQSFPDAFVFEGEWADAVARIGNSVPPLLMRAIARHLRERILGV